MNKLLEIRTLADRFMEGATSLAEEQRLLQLLQQEQLPHDLLPLREMMEDLACVSSHLRAPAPSHPRIFTARRIAAALLILVTSVATVLWWSHRQTDECVAYIYGKRCTDREVVLKEMHQSIDIIAEGDNNNVDQMLNDMFDL